MATATGKAHCVTCGKEKSSYKCGGCSQDFCFNHLADHKQELSKQFDDIEVNRDIFRQTLTEQTSNPEKHSLIQQINEWEHESINKIRQTADEIRQLTLKNTTGHIRELETKLNKLTEQLRQSRQENDFNETDLRQFQEELSRLTIDLSKPSNVSIRQHSMPLIRKISIDVISASIDTLNIGDNASWSQNGVTVVGGNGYGNGLNQLSSPFGVYVDDDQTIYVADCSNNRIIKQSCNATNSQVVVQQNGDGNQTDQLKNPTDVIVDKEKDCLIICDQGNRRVVRWPLQKGTREKIIISNIDCYGLTMDNNGCLYVSDYVKHEVRRWREEDTFTTVIADGNGEGNSFDQLNYPTYIFVDQNHSVYISDNQNHRVMKWVKGAKEGIVVAGGQGEGSSLAHLSYPNGVVVDQLGTLFVAEYGNNRVVRWAKGTQKGSIIVGGTINGKDAKQLDSPIGLSFDRQGNLYVVDMHNDRVQRFDIDLNLN